MVWVKVGSRSRLTWVRFPDSCTVCYFRIRRDIPNGSNGTKFLVPTVLCSLYAQCSPTCTQRHHSVDTYPSAEALVASALGRGVAGANHVATGLVSLVRIWERPIATKASFSFQYSQQGEKGVPLVVAITATPEWGKLGLQFQSVTVTSVTVTK